MFSAYIKYKDGNEVIDYKFDTLEDFIAEILDTNVSDIKTYKKENIDCDITEDLGYVFHNYRTYFSNKETLYEALIDFIENDVENKNIYHKIEIKSLDAGNEY